MEVLKEFAKVLVVGQNMKIVGASGTNGADVGHGSTSTSSQSDHNRASAGYPDPRNTHPESARSMVIDRLNVLLSLARVSDLISNF